MNRLKCIGCIFARVFENDPLPARMGIQKIGYIVSILTNDYPATTLG